MHSLQLNLQIYFNSHYSTAYNYVYTHHMYLKTFVLFLFNFYFFYVQTMTVIGLITACPLLRVMHPDNCE